MARTRDLWRDTARRGHGKRWLAVWTGPDGREQAKAFAKKTDADRYGAAQETDADRGTYVDPRAGSATLREYATGKYLPSLVHLRPNSASTYESHLHTHIVPLLGDRRMRTLARSDMKAFVAAKSAELAPATVETVFAVLRALMSAAVDDGVIPANPCTRVPLPAVAPREVEPLPAAAVLALEAALPGRYRVMVPLGAGAGLRFGEATGLTVPRVDFLRRRLHIREQAQNGALAPLKTRASLGTVPVDDWVLGAITGHMQRYGTGPGEVIVANAAGRLVRRNAFGSVWRAAVTAAGLPQGTRFHALWHFYASALIRANLNPKVVQARLRHATIAETMDTYGHLFPDSEDLGRGAVEDALAAAQAEQGRNKSVH
jgi:integrase